MDEGTTRQILPCLTAGVVSITLQLLQKKTAQINSQQEHHHGTEDFEEELKRLVDDAGLTWYPDMTEG